MRLLGLIVALAVSTAGLAVVGVPAANGRDAQHRPAARHGHRRHAESGNDQINRVVRRAGRSGLDKLVHQLGRFWGKATHLGFLGIALFGVVVLLVLRKLFVVVVILALLAALSAAGVALPHLPF